MATIKKIEASILPTTLTKRVAAYARVSSAKDAMIQSLSAQVSYYNTHISVHPGWKLVEVYSDEGISGTKDNRPGFQRMLDDCRSGKVDMILTKSITRFARNTVTLLETIRELKELNVDVFFEKENIHTLSSDGEFMITLLASYAQEEARSASENQLWRIRRMFEEGRSNTCHIYGYRYSRNGFVIFPIEANVVRQIFNLYLSGMGHTRIAKLLREIHAPTRFGGQWSPTVICNMLKNRVYLGELLLQKTYHENYMTKRRVLNNGEKPKYEVLEAHEAIISEDIFNAVQEEMTRRRDEKRKSIEGANNTQLLTPVLRCGVCGRGLRKRTNNGRTVWLCRVFAKFGKEYCNAKQIREDILMDLLSNELGIEEITEEDILRNFESIIVNNDQTLEITYRSGESKVLPWEQKSRKDSWTDEMKEEARQNARKRLSKNAGSKEN